MKVLVIGSGGREHALCWKIRSSPLVKEVFCAPGNPGISGLANCVPHRAEETGALAEFALKNGIELTIVGPEAPLSSGIVDVFRQKGLRIFGPSKAAAQLESSKLFAKEVMKAAGVPTAGYQLAEGETQLKQIVQVRRPPAVLKADGLASGKGVYVCTTFEELKDGVSGLYSKIKPQKVLVEDFISGREVSFIVATDGKRVVSMATSHDYKRLLDGDEGPNTGGMGAVSPSPRISSAGEAEVIEKVIRPTLREMERRGTPFAGFLYAGLMLSDDGKINVLEFNVRMGDPECQAILRRMDSDLVKLVMDLTDPGSKASEAELVQTWSSEPAICVVHASEGYPDSPKSGAEINGLKLAGMVPGSVVFHSGTRAMPDGKIIAGSGRVLSVTARGSSLEEARAKAYKASELVQFNGRHFRKDIGTKG